MTTHKKQTVARRLSRSAVVAGGLVVGSAAGPAFASPPTTWQQSTHEGFLHYALVLGGIPLLIIAVITLLVYLPSMMKRQSSEDTSAFQEHPEWFGGPRRGVEATRDPEDEPVDTSRQGGASARW